MEREHYEICKLAHFFCRWFGRVVGGMRVQMSGIGFSGAPETRRNGWGQILLSIEVSIANWYNFSGQLIDGRGGNE